MVSETGCATLRRTQDLILDRQKQIAGSLPSNWNLIPRHATTVQKLDLACAEREKLSHQFVACKFGQTRSDLRRHDVIGSHMLFCEGEFHIHWRHILVGKRCAGVISAKWANELLFLFCRGAGSVLQNSHPMLVLLYISLDFLQRLGDIMVIPIVQFCLFSLVCKEFLSNIVQGDKILLQQRRWSLALIGPVNSSCSTQIEIIIIIKEKCSHTNIRRICSLMHPFQQLLLSFDAACSPFLLALQQRTLARSFSTFGCLIFCDLMGFSTYLVFKLDFAHDGRIDG